eukprot:125498_1
MGNQTATYINIGENTRNIKFKNENNTYFDNDIDDMLDEIALEIDEQYDDTNIIEENELSFIPPENHVNNIYDEFTYEKQLGSGASCCVLLVTDNNTNKQYALKFMERRTEENGKIRKSQIK